MWPPVTSMILCGCLCVFLAVASTASGPILYRALGDEVVLKPDYGSADGPITSIIWKHGPDIAMEWDGTDIDSFRHFKERGKLNNSSGEMTITGLTREDSGVYTVEINGKTNTPIELRVISAVSTPTVSKSCNEEKTSCTFTCVANITGAEQVTYNWNLGDGTRSSSQTLTITKGNSPTIKELICELKNRVSEASSQAILNPFIMVDDVPEPEQTEGGLKINTGLTVFICLLTVVVLLGLIHRWKAGMWFFQKASMPWEADFWKKDRQPVIAIAASESNGTPARQDKMTDEETPMA